MKTCVACKKPYPDELFVGARGGEVKTCSYCREKINRYGRAWRNANPDKRQEYAKRYKEENKQRDLQQRREAQRRYYKKHRERIRAKENKKRHYNIEAVRKIDRDRYADDPSKKIASAKRYYNSNAEKVAERLRRCREENRKFQANADMESLFPGMLIAQIMGKAK